MKKRDGRGNCKSCVVSAICLSKGVEGLLSVLHSMCFHCGKVRLRKRTATAIDLDCGWFDARYHNLTMRMKICKECEIEVQEMREISEGKDSQNNVRGSTQRRKR